MKIFLSVILILSLNLQAQVTSADSVEIIPGAEYKAGGMYRILFGDHWRELWTMPVKVPVLDLHAFAGGITPYSVGGGQQTRSLKFNGNDGQRWKFRSINKDPSKLLPPEVRDSFVDEVLQDQISSANPFSAIISAELLRSVGVLQAVPQMVVLPDDPILAEFRKEFAGMLGTIEVHPDEAEESNLAEFFDTEKIKGTFKLFGTVEEKRNDKVHPEEFLKVRLMDVLMGDWDRHADQWRWAKVEEENFDYWIPIPRDRDQSFAKFDGLFPSVAEYLVPQLSSFDYDYPQIEDLTWNGRHIDRRFLTELTKEKWDSIAAFIQTSLTDDAIERAVKKMPPNQFKVAGEELITKLIARRDKLNEVVDEYYELLNTVADVYGTLKDDYVLVERLNDDSTSVTIYELDKSEQRPEGIAYFQKVFSNTVTDEIRIHMLDDDDYCLVTGEVNNGPLVRVIGGEGRDIMADNSKVHGYLYSVTPFRTIKNRTYFYDGGNKTTVLLGEGTSFDDNEWNEPEDIIEKYEPSQRNRGVNWVALPDAGYSTVNGVELGANLSLYSYDFRKVPYKSLQVISFMYAFLPKSYNIEYSGEFNDVFNKVDFLLNIGKNELDVVNYFGFGNENSFDKNLYEQKFYKMDQETFSVNPQLRFKLSKNINLRLGFFYEYNQSSLSNNTLLNNFEYGNYGLGVMQSVGSNFSLQLDSRDNKDFAIEGDYAELTGKLYNELRDDKETYFLTTFDLRHYFSFDFPLSSTIALKASGGKIWGKFPFYNSVFLGGNNNLRGYKEGRFSGEAALAFQSEFRTKVLESFWVLKGDVGIHLLAETGRVFASNINSAKWHYSYGGGIWGSYLDRALVFAFTVAAGKDEVNFYIDTMVAF